MVVGDTLGTIIGLGPGIGELTRDVERVRRRLNDTPHVNLTSVWSFSAVLALPAVRPHCSPIPHPDSLNCRRHGRRAPVRRRAERRAPSGGVGRTGAPSGSAFGPSASGQRGVLQSNACSIYCLGETLKGG
jgi:hypothetical protein